VFESFRALLSEELGVAPSVSMQRLVRDLPRSRYGDGHWPEGSLAQHRVPVAPRGRSDVVRDSAAPDRA
jgi:hypothetical protein